MAFPNQGVIMANWIVKTYHKKNVEQHEYFVQREGSGRIKVIDGFRWATFRVTTTDDNFPEFEFTQVPGGNDANDSVDLFSCSTNNIVGSEMIDMFDGGCWGDTEIEGIEDEEELEKLIDKTKSEMAKAAAGEDFITAAQLRDEMFAMQKLLAAK